MIPLIVAGAVSVASDVADAWKAHVQNVASTEAAKNADFQAALKTAASGIAQKSQEAAAAQKAQQTQAIPGEIESVTQQILQAPQVQSMVRSSPTGTLNLQFDASGNVFAPTVGGRMRQLAVTPEVQQELQQLSSAMHGSGAGASATGAQVSAVMGSNHMPVQVNLTAL